MNSSLATADSSTHIKIVAIALLAAMVVIWVGIAGRSSSGLDGNARIERSFSDMRLGPP
jgi:hypothetical protein